MAALRIVFMGTPTLACASLQALIGRPEFQIAAVVTQPDRPKGRDLKFQPSPVKEIALQQNIPVLQPERARDEKFIHVLSELQPELIVVAAFGQILPKTILDLPRFGCINVHTSLLPKYHGAAPIQWAVLNGEPETGVTIMKMDAGLDTGGILTQRKTPIAPADNSQTLHDRLAVLGAELLLQTIPDFIAGKIQPCPQPVEGVSHAPKIKKQDGQIDWNESGRAIQNRVRAMVPWPGAFTFWFGVPPSGGLSAQVGLSHEGGTPKRQMLKIWETETVEQSGTPGEILKADKTGVIVGCGHGALRILTLQSEGGRRMTAQEFLAGHPLKAGGKFC
jgi:methionyl-tRNA formyltransferase